MRGSINAPAPARPPTDQINHRRAARPLSFVSFGFRRASARVRHTRSRAPIPERIVALSCVKDLRQPPKCAGSRASNLVRDLRASGTMTAGGRTTATATTTTAAAACCPLESRSHYLRSSSRRRRFLSRHRRGRHQSVWQTSAPVMAPVHGLARWCWCRHSVPNHRQVRRRRRRWCLPRAMFRPMLG